MPPNTMPIANQGDAGAAPRVQTSKASTFGQGLDSRSWLAGGDVTHWRSMRKVILYMFTTLDGFIAGPNGEFDDYEPSDEEMDFANGLFGSLGGIMFGRVIYEQFVEYWDSLDLFDGSVPPRDAEFARIFRQTPRIVFSRKLEAVPDDTVLIRDDLAARITELKCGTGSDLGLICGPELLSTLVGLDVVDECIVLVKPKATGRGLALFGELGDVLRLQLLATHAFESGTVMHHYRLLND